MSVLSLDDVVALNALIVTAVGLSLALSGRKNRTKTYLNLRAGGPRIGAAVPAQVSVQRAGRAVSGDTYGTDALARLETQSSEIRELNVFFNWNGHTWDAYEVLGIPAGAPRDRVVEAFHASRARSPDSTPFFQAATDAILKRKF